MPQVSAIFPLPSLSQFFETRALFDAEPGQLCPGQIVPGGTLVLPHLLEVLPVAVPNPDFGEAQQHPTGWVHAPGCSRADDLDQIVPPELGFVVCRSCAPASLGQWAENLSNIAPAFEMLYSAHVRLVDALQQEPSESNAALVLACLLEGFRYLSYAQEQVAETASQPCDSDLEGPARSSGWAAFASSVLSHLSLDLQQWTEDPTCFWLKNLIAASSALDDSEDPDELRLMVRSDRSPSMWDVLSVFAVHAKKAPVSGRPTSFIYVLEAPRWLAGASSAQARPWDEQYVDSILAMYDPEDVVLGDVEQLAAIAWPYPG